MPRRDSTAEVSNTRIAWIEVRCDCEVEAETGFAGEPDCVGSGGVGFYTTVADAFRAAKNEGWKRIPGFGWVCPRCYKNKTHVEMQRKQSD